MKMLFGVLLIFTTNVFALEIDEKLTVRILRTSESRKTVMINRGIEDGLAEGDHAKFIVTAGIVARGVAVKVSPTRSVWSIYRLVNADFIVNDAVMSIKISPPVKVTQDETKNLVQEDTPASPLDEGPKSLGIPLAEGANDLSKDGDQEASELLAMKTELPEIIPEKNKEVFVITNISSLSAKTSPDSGGDSYSHSQSYHHLGLGGELYAQNEREWYSRWSLLASLNLMRLNNQSYNGSSSTNDVTELGLGAHWHFSKLPSVVMEFIPFLHFGLHFGTVKSSYSEGSENSAVDSLSGSGSTRGFSLGFGYKFFTHHGYGARVLLDYYTRSESYDEDDQGNTFTKSLSGPRFMVGFGYRF
jgi:hypothetical protein